MTGMSGVDLRRAAEAARDLVREVGEVVRGLQGKVETRDKGHGLGLVTEADLRAEHLLIEGLEERFPGETILSEETRDSVDPDSPRIWCVDPIDGTREYSRGMGEYAVMVGLLVEGEPRAGAFSIPADGQVFWGWTGGGAFLGDQPLRLDTITDLSDAVAIHSRSHTNLALKRAVGRLGVRESIAAGSVGYKVGQILSGRAHVYVHTRGGTQWWDSVAPAAVLCAAGGGCAAGTGEPLRYDGNHLHLDGLLYTAPGLLEAACARLRP